MRARGVGVPRLRRVSLTVARAEVLMGVVETLVRARAASDVESWWIFSGRWMALMLLS